jgi:cytochrome P450
MLKLFHHLEEFSALMEPGSTPPVDNIPFLIHIPEILLGNWKTRAAQVSKQMNALYSRYLDIVISRREEGIMKGSFMDAVLNQAKNLALTGVDRHSTYFLGGTMTEGGSDTTSALISSFIYAMTKWPEVMKKAQSELDRVVGEDRTPTFDDYDHLPYIAATVKETMRWRPIGALGTPHCVSQDPSNSLLSGAF